MLSLEPASSAASTSARADSSGEVRSLSSTLQAVIGQHAMHAVAADQEPVVLAQSDGGVIEAREILEADGAVEQMGEIAASGDVVLGQPLQAAFAQAVGAGVADVNARGSAAATGSSTEKAQLMPLSSGIDAALRIDPAIGGFERARRPAPHAERFGQANNRRR